MNHRHRLSAALITAALAVTGCGAATATSNPTPPTPTNELQGSPLPTTTIQVDLSFLNTTTTSQLPPTVTPAAAETPPLPGPVSDDCWMDLARSVGWPEDTLATLQRIIRRESGCNPSSYANRPSTLDNSRGLLQINAYGNLHDHIRQVCGVEPEQLFDPATNLSCGLVYWQRSGWSPWGGA